MNLPHQRRNPVKVRRTVRDGVVTIMVARLDGSGPLYRTSFPEADPIEVRLALLEPTMGGVMRALREAHGLSQIEAAAAIDANESTIRGIESDRTRRNSWTAGLCALWGVSYEEVLHGPRLRRSDAAGALSGRLRDFLGRNSLSHREAEVVFGVSRDRLKRIMQDKGVRPGIRDTVEAFIASCRIEGQDYDPGDVDGGRRGDLVDGDDRDAARPGMSA